MLSNDNVIMSSLSLEEILLCQDDLQRVQKAERIFKKKNPTIEGKFTDFSLSWMNIFRYGWGLSQINLVFQGFHQFLQTH